MENIIRGTTPSLILDFADEPDLSVDDIDILAFTIKRRTGKEVLGLNDFVRNEEKLIYQFTEEKTLSYTASERITFQCDVLANGQRYRVFDGSAKVEETEYPEVMGNG